MNEKIMRIMNNAMFYKDVTQWLRKRTFVVLFLGYLALAELISLITISLPLSPGQSGPVAFAILSSVLFAYMIIIGFMGYSLTNSELTNNTFELYELCGMSLEGMVRGKVMSLIYQFLFGFFCTIPFMFFAYIMGGIDFLVILAMAVIIGLAALPVYLLSVFMALVTRFKNISGLGKFVGLFTLIVILPYLILMFMIMMLSNSNLMISPIVDYIKLLLQFDLTAALLFVFFMLFYVQICMLLFYLSCNAISPSTDSRETSIKLLCFTLSVSWLGSIAFLCWYESYDRAADYIAIVPVYIIMCFLGITFFFNRLKVPVMAKNRSRKAKFFLKRWIYFWFEAGPWGTFRMIILFYISTLVYWWLMVKVLPGISKSPGWGKLNSNNFFAAVSLALHTPFFLAVPGIFLICIKQLRRKMNNLRTAIMLWWVFSGAFIMIVLGYYSEGFLRGDKTMIIGILEFAALIFSPLAGSIVGTFNNSYLMEVPAAYMRFGLGIIGLILMFSMLRKWTEIESVEALMNSSKAEMDTRESSEEKSEQMAVDSLPAE